MKAPRRIQLRVFHGALDEVSYHLTRIRFSHAALHTWRPAINAYRCETCIRICVDLAGVDRADIDLEISPHRLVLRGVRDIAEPEDEHGRPLRTIAMEIDYGPFERAFELPDEVDVDQAEAEQKIGLLWICLPLKNR